MKYFLLVFFFASQFAIAQSPLSYVNSNGDKHLAGPIELDDLRTDTTYSGWFESNYARFQLKGGDTSVCISNLRPK
ncbi:hypothetical protein [Algoriphagus terrigena]|uniref:hypothetical protein n=1 Tax=Algoriphagus terrigena TaxID=344884 RepID=UPI000413CC84|nr:hypothetical protein [Algoriphagus terrigena]